jgi:hypothetical protein
MDADGDCLARPHAAGVFVSQFHRGHCLAAAGTAALFSNFKSGILFLLTFHTFPHSNLFPHFVSTCLDGLKTYNC